MQRNRQGIVLVIGLVLATLMLMFVGAAMALGPASLQASQNVGTQVQARQAAESGVQYALGRLRADPAWRGDANALVVNEPDLQVVEDNGNVVGHVRASDGQWSQFRLRFNHQDGAGGEDGLDDPTSLSLATPYVSVNNLTGGADAQAPRADGPNHSVTANSPRPYSVPRWSVLLAVEGRAGRVDPNDPLAETGAVRCCVEGIYQVGELGDDGQLLDAAAMAAGNVRANLSATNGKVEVTGKAGRVPRLRAMGQISVAGGDASENYRSDDGFVHSGNGSLAALYDSTRVTVDQENGADPFYALAWSNVRKPDPAVPKLKAGTYVWWQDGTLHYYEMNYADYVAHIQANPQDAGEVNPPLPGQVVSDGSGKKVLRFNSSVEVAAAGDVEDFSVLTREGAPEEPPPAAVPSAGVSMGVAAVVAPAVLASPQNLNSFMAQMAPLDGSMVVVDQNDQVVFTGNWSWNNGQVLGGYNGVPLPTAYMFCMNPDLFPDWHIASSTHYTTPSLQSVTDWATAHGVQLPPPDLAPGEIKPPGVNDTLKASDLEIEFAGNGEPVVLSSSGDIRLTGSIKGSGGSIISEGDIRITGLGADFSANEVNGVNLYAKGDIVFSSLDEVSPGQYEYRDVNLKGIVYTWGDFQAKLGNSALNQFGKLNLEGMMVAYGGDPSGDPGTNGRGTIDVNAEAVNLVFDPSYLGGLTPTLPANFKFRTLSWSSRLP